MTNADAGDGLAPAPQVARPAPSPGPVRRFLNFIYDGAAIVAALCLVGLLCVIVAQMIARWSGVSFPGSTQYAGYLMAASSFLAFAHALNRGAHIRVTLLFNALGRHARWAELWSLVIGAAASSYLAYFAVRAVYWSHKLHDVSQGQDMTPLWMAQAPMALGAVLLAICFIDNLVTFMILGHDNVELENLEQSHAE